MRPAPCAGVRLPLPDGYAGVVMQRQQQGAGTSAAAGGSQEEPGWEATAAFTHLHYHQHDAAPLRGDGLRRCLDWVGLAAALHAPVSPAAVAEAAAADAGRQGAGGAAAV